MPVLAGRHGVRGLCAWYLAVVAYDQERENASMEYPAILGAKEEPPKHCFVMSM